MHINICLNHNVIYQIFFNLFEVLQWLKFYLSNGSLPLVRSQQLFVIKITLTALTGFEVIKFGSSFKSHIINLHFKQDMISYE